jgi:hypothetical protein
VFKVCVIILGGTVIITSALFATPKTPQAKKYVVSDNYVVLVEGECVEYRFYLPTTGLYEVWLTSTGNDTRQAAQISVDSGEPVLVIDEREPERALLPKEREKIVVRQLVGVVSLKKGKHFLKVCHARETGFSTAFGFQKIELVCTEVATDKRIILAGSQRKPSATKEPWQSKDFRPAPKWWRKEEVYAGWYRGLSEDVLKRIKEDSFQVVIVGARGDLHHWVKIAHKLNLRLLPYVSFHTWRWRFSPEEGKERLADEDLLSSFKHAREHKGDLRWLEYWALAEHPEWMLLNSEGKPVSPFSPEYQAGSIREPCLDTPGVKEACLALAKLLMDEGADGLFVDNVHPSGKCYGEKFGLHKHLHPEWDNATAYKEMLREVRALVKRYGDDKIVMLNSGDPRKFFADVGDVLMWESFLFDGGEKPRMLFQQVLGAKKFWEPYLKSGGTIATLSYFGGPPELRKRNAFYAYACAKLCGFHFSDWFTANGSGAEVLYRLRLGKAVSDVEEINGVWLRRYQNGFVAVNPDGEGQPEEAIQKLPPRMLTLNLPSSWRTVMDVYEKKLISMQKSRITIPIPAFSGRVIILVDKK